VIDFFHLHSSLVLGSFDSSSHIAPNQILFHDRVCESPAGFLMAYQTTFIQGYLPLRDPAQQGKGFFIQAVGISYGRLTPFRAV
jgi:hypothetical protein